MNKDKKRLLTIVIPCFNAEKYFERCVTSLEGINSDMVTILFVNDGSTDSTLFLIERWIQTHTNSFVINKKNGGYSSAINAGLDNCNSEYVMFMGVDDELVSDGINNVCSHLQRNSPDILVFSTRKIYDEPDDTVTAGEIDSYTNFVKPGLYELDLYSLYNRIGHDSMILFTRDTSRCFKTNVIGEIRYFGKRGVSADGCFSSMVASKSKSFEFLNEVCYLWHLHKDSVSSKKTTPEGVEEELNVWSKFFSWVAFSFPIKGIPSPIIVYLLEYKRKINIVYEEGRMDLVSEHNKMLQKFSRNILANYTLSTKDRIKLMHPKLYKIYTYIRFKH